MLPGAGREGAVSGALITIGLLVVIAVIYLIILGIAHKALLEHKRKFPAEADVVEEERDL